MSENPYATTTIAAPKMEYGRPQLGYFAVPEHDNAPISGFGWAPRLSSAGTPDPLRIGTQPRRDYRPRASRPWEFWRRLGADRMGRHSVETQDADGWEERKGSKRFAPNPRSVPPPEPRPTTAMAPRSYMFTRPFDTGYARQLNGVHFSMADHRRTYDIFGMQPVRNARNTYRVEPAPWDADIYDVPPDVEPTVIPGKVQAVDIPPSPNRSWRL